MEGISSHLPLVQTATQEAGAGIHSRFSIDFPPLFDIALSRTCSTASWSSFLSHTQPFRQ